MTPVPAEWWLRPVRRAARLGEHDQVPPMYSAKKQSGRKLYELAM